MNKSKVLGLVLILLILAAGVYYFYFLRQNQNNVSPEQVFIDRLMNRKIYSEGNLPEGFPKDFPIETGVEVLENFTAGFATKENNVRLQDGTLATWPEFKQSTYSYVSNKNLEENFKIFKDYFTAQKYKLLAESNVSGTASLLFSIKDGSNETFQFSASVYPISNKIRVTIDKIFPIFSFENGSVIAN